MKGRMNESMSQMCVEKRYAWFDWSIPLPRSAKYSGAGRGELRPMSRSFTKQCVL